MKIGCDQPAVWRCIGLKDQGDQEDDQAFEERVRAFDLSKNRAEKLHAKRKVLGLKVPPDETLPVQLPSTYTHSLTCYICD